MYEFDISPDTRAYDPRDHLEDDDENDVIYVFNESSSAWEKQLCSQTKGVYADIVKIYTPVLREIYREFVMVEIFHPGPDTTAADVFACWDRDEQNAETGHFETVRDLYRARIRPTSLKTLALEKILDNCPGLVDLEAEKLAEIGIPQKIITLFEEHREWECEKNVPNFVIDGNSESTNQQEKNDDEE